MPCCLSLLLLLLLLCRLLRLLPPLLPLLQPFLLLLLLLLRLVLLRLVLLPLRNCNRPRLLFQGIQLGNLLLLLVHLWAKEPGQRFTSRSMGRLLTRLPTTPTLHSYETSCIANWPGCMPPTTSFAAPCKPTLSARLAAENWALMPCPLALQANRGLDNRLHTLKSELHQWRATSGHCVPTKSPPGQVCACALVPMPPLNNQPQSEAPPASSLEGRQAAVQHAAQKNLRLRLVHAADGLQRTDKQAQYSTVGGGQPQLDRAAAGSPANRWSAQTATPRSSKLGEDVSAGAGKQRACSMTSPKEAVASSAASTVIDSCTHSFGQQHAA